MRDYWDNAGELAMAKFKIVKVHSFRIGNKRYVKGETIELSEEDAERLKGADFIDPVKEEKRIRKAETYMPPLGPAFPYAHTLRDVGLGPRLFCGQ